MRYESFELEGSQVLDRVKCIIHEGHARRIIIRSEGRTVAEFPLTPGAISHGSAPVLAAIGALAALLAHCTVEVERPEMALAGRR